MKKDNLEVNRKLDINKNNKGVFDMKKMNEDKGLAMDFINKEAEALKERETGFHQLLLNEKKNKYIKEIVLNVLFQMVILFLVVVCVLQLQSIVTLTFVTFISIILLVLSWLNVFESYKELKRLKKTKNI